MVLPTDTVRTRGRFGVDVELPRRAVGAGRGAEVRGGGHGVVVGVHAAGNHGHLIRQLALAGLRAP